MTIVLFVWIFYALFLVYCAVKRSGKFKTLPLPVKLVIGSYLIAAWLLDLVFNWSLGWMLFLEAPWGRGVLFTARCKYHRSGYGWRRKVADWFCEGWLVPFDAGHC